MAFLHRTAYCSILVLAGCHIVSGLDGVAEVSSSDAGGNAATTSGAGGTGGSGGTGGFCGDGEVNQASEECDGGDGQPIDTISCDADCTMVVCGDGYTNQNAGESCDDGNTENGDGCSDQCVLESCGNMELDAGEECDDGNANNNDDCLDNCNLPRCGDGFLHNEQSGTEQCDDGDSINNDDCPDGANGTCMPASCGDGFLHDQESGTEQCDDSNTNQNDDCLNNCMDAVCGDGFIHNQGNGTEVCDDDNTTNGDGCSSTCAQEAGACCSGEPSTCVAGPFNLVGMMLNDPIPDGGHPSMRACHTYNFMQMGCGNVVDVNVTVGIDHGYLSDVIVRLEGPDTTQADIMDLPGGDDSNLGSPFPVTFDDEASVSAIMMGAGIPNSQFVCQSSPCDYIPFPDPLSAYDGSSPVGAWTVCVSDAVLMDAGTLQSVDIEIATN